MKELEKNELMAVDGGGLLDFAIGYAIDGLWWAVKQTTDRGTLMNMNQVDLYLWN